MQLETATGRLMGLTETGLYHLSTLRLNRPALIAYRKNQMLKKLNAQMLEQTMAENALLRDSLAEWQRYVQSLLERAERNTPDT